MLAATIECPCNRSMLDRSFSYTEPPIGETKFDWSGNQYQRRFDRCRACRHYFGVHELNVDDLYRGTYVDSTYGDQMAVMFDRITSLPADLSDNSGRCKRVVSFAEQQPGIPAKPSILDVGSGLGVFPYAMKMLGWSCTALDPDPKACEHIDARVGVETIAADLLTIEPTRLGTYDVVTLNKVLEHVVNPCSMLRRAAAATKNQGFLYLEVPDGDGAAPHGKGREEFFVEHHHVFSATSLSAIVERAGLRMVRLDRLVEPSGKFTLACFAVPKVAPVEVTNEV